MANLNNLGGDHDAIEPHVYIENEDLAKVYLDATLQGNHRLNLALLDIQDKLSEDELKSCKLALGYMMANSFDYIIGPIIEKHPSLVPEDFGWVGEEPS